MSIAGQPSAARLPIRPWRALHAGHEVRQIAALLEAQLLVGMRPSILTPAGLASAEDWLHSPPAADPPAVSLLGAWNDVRQWRRALLEAAHAADLVHAHTFSSGMAAVRNCPVVVYEVEGFVEELAITAGQAESGSWLARSFRVAEQFVLARAGAVVVRSAEVRDGVMDRGAAPANVFLVPATLDARHLGERYHAVYRHAWSRRKPDPLGPVSLHLQPLPASF